MQGPRSNPGEFQIGFFQPYQAYDDIPSRAWQSAPHQPHGHGMLYVGPYDSAMAARRQHRDMKGRIERLQGQIRENKRFFSSEQRKPAEGASAVEDEDHAIMEAVEKSKEVEAVDISGSESPGRVGRVDPEQKDSVEQCAPADDYSLGAGFGVGHGTVDESIMLLAVSSTSCFPLNF